VLNAGMGLYVYGLAQGLKEAFELARNTMESGAAAEQLEKWIAASAAAAAADAPVAAQ
jgi:anthranilate phosphoribosyltransferase